jgi:hypothetical protein
VRQAFPDRARAATAGDLQSLVVALGYTVSVTVAAAGDFTVLDALAASRDAGLRWIARPNLGKSRLGRWPAEVDRIASLLG